MVGQVKVGTLADLVVWKFENFGAKPEMVLKSGIIVSAQVCLLVYSSYASLTLAHRWEIRTLQFRQSSPLFRDQCGGLILSALRSTLCISFPLYRLPLAPWRRTD